jgi:hypothetical protein
MFVVKTLDMTNWLCQQGFEILKVEDSEKDRRFKVFLFRDTQNLRNKVDEYLLIRKAG